MNFPIRPRYNFYGNLGKNASPGPALSWLAEETYEAVWGFTGICEGKKFLKWIEKVIYDETNIPFCTFGELANLVKNGNGTGKIFRHLHVIATRLKSKKIVDFNSENKKWKDLIISEAIRASISLPIVFKPHIPIFRRKIENKEVYCVNRTFDSGFKSDNYDKLMAILDKTQKIEEYSYVDGGCLMNFPLELFG